MNRDECHLEVLNWIGENCSSTPIGIWTLVKWQLVNCCHSAIGIWTLVKWQLVNCCHSAFNTFWRSVESTGNTVDTYCHMNIIVAPWQRSNSVTRKNLKKCHSGGYHSPSIYVKASNVPLEKHNYSSQHKLCPQKS